MIFIAARDGATAKKVIHRLGHASPTVDGGTLKVRSGAKSVLTS
jgi:hypothetical protein